MNIQRGDVWLVSLGQTVGAEIRKTRPVVVVSRDNVGVLDLKVIVPITGWQPQYAANDWMTLIEPEPGTGILKRSAADALQVKSLAVERFQRKLGRLNNATMDQVEYALRFALEL